MDPTPLLGLACVIIVAIGVWHSRYDLLDPHGYKQLQKPLEIVIHKTRVFPDEIGDDFETYFRRSKSIVTEITFITQKGRRRSYVVKDFPSDGYFPNDSDGLVDDVGERKIHFADDQHGQRSYIVKVPFDEKLYQILTEKYNRVLQEQLKSGDILR